MSEIVDIIRQLIKRELVASVVTGKVKSVDKQKLTCIVVTTNEDLELMDVKLKPSINKGSGDPNVIIMFPKPGTDCTVALINDDVANTILLDSNEIESVKITVGSKIKMSLQSDGKITMEADEILFNNGSNGGIPIAENIASRVNRLEVAMETHGHAVSGSAASPVGANVLFPLKTNANDLTNNKIKH